jgi:hypothetical protein
LQGRRGGGGGGGRGEGENLACDLSFDSGNFLFSKCRHKRWRIFVPKEKKNEERRRTKKGEEGRTRKKKEDERQRQRESESETVENSVRIRSLRELLWSWI